MYDYIYIANSQSGAQYYQVYELGNSMQRIRFTYKLSHHEVEKIDMKNFSKGRFRKSLQFTFYGLTLLNKECTMLINLIREYTGLTPSFKPGLLNEEETS